ncbi:MAG TPA: LTA synthase family protein [Methylomirabilota bacterium]
MSESPRPLRLAAHAAGLVALNLLIFTMYRAMFVAWFGSHARGSAAAVIFRGLRLDAAALAAEVVAVGLLLLVTRRARGALLAAVLWTLTTINLLVAGIDLLFYHERSQHLWEMLFANLAEPHDIWVALKPFLLQNPGTVALLLALVAGLATLAVVHARRLRAHRHDLWRPWPVPAVGIAALALIGLLMGHWTTVKRVFPHASLEFVWISSRHQMAFNDYVLNQAVVNPVWDLLHEYLPTAITGSRPPYRLAAREALPLAQRLLGVPLGDRPYPLLRTVHGIGGLGIRNVVVIQVEGLGTSMLERDEPQGPVMPYVRSLIAEGLYFPRVYQSFFSTDGAVFATSTGLHWTNAFSGGSPRLTESVLGAYFASLPRMTDGHGRRSFAFSGFRHRTADFVSFTRNLGYRATGFEALAGRLGPRAAEEAGPLGVHDGPLLREAAATAAATKDAFTLYVMTATSHSPWTVPDGAATPLGNGPVGTFRYVDDSIRAFVERLRAQRTDFDQTLIVVTGDHTSIPFGTQRIERLQVPLVLAGPPMARARARWPARSEAEVSQVDILPTIASLLDGTRPYAGMGRSMLEPRPPDGAGIITSDRTDTFYFKDGFALRYDLQSGDSDLFEVTRDELRPTDVSAQHPEEARRLTREFLALYETTDRLMRENRVFPRAR